MKYIIFEKKKVKNYTFLTDDVFEDPKKLDLTSLNNLKKKLLVNYHWDNQKKIIKDHPEINRIIKRSFSKIYQLINKFHGVNYSRQYWEIIVLPWYTHLIYFLFNKWEIVNSIKNPKKYCALIYNYQDKDFLFKVSTELNIPNRDLNLWIISSNLQNLTKIQEIREIY